MQSEHAIYLEIPYEDFALTESEETSTYMILDACSEPLLPAEIQSFGAESLWQGNAQRDFWSIAPYLVPANEQILEWTLANLASGTWGLLIESTYSFTDLRSHLRKFLTVKLPDDRQVYFRFYDPRVLTSYVDSCSPEEFGLLMSHVSRFIAPREQTWLGITSRPSVGQAQA